MNDEGSWRREEYQEFRGEGYRQSATLPRNADILVTSLGACGICRMNGEGRVLNCDLSVPVVCDG